MSVSIFLIILAIIIIIYILFLYKWVYKKDKIKFWDLLNSFFITFLSLALSFVIAIILFNYESHESGKSQKNKLRSLLSAELNQQLQLLSIQDGVKILGPQGEIDTLFLTQLQTTGLENAISSGLFESDITQNMSRLNQSILYFNSLSQSFINLTPFMIKGDPNIQAYINGLKEVRRNLIIFIRELIAKLYKEEYSEISTNSEILNSRIYFEPVITVNKGSVQIDLSLLMNTEWNGEIVDENMMLNVKRLENMEPGIQLCKAYIIDNPYLAPLEELVGYNKGFSINPYYWGHPLGVSLVGVLDRDTKGKFLGIASVPKDNQVNE